MNLANSPLTKLGRDDRGALTLSYVAVLPFVFLVIMVAIQASFWFLARTRHSRRHARARTLGAP